MQKNFGNRLFVGALCVGMATTVGATSVLASSYDEMDMAIAGVAAAIEQENTNNTNANTSGQDVLVPLAAAAVIENVSGVPEVTQEHAAVQALEARQAAAQDSAYKDVAISQVANYVNIRQEPNADAEILGKIYNNAAAAIKETVTMEDGDWYLIESGSVTGYIKAEYFVTGEAAEKIAKEVGDVRAKINTETLRLRENADLASPTLSLLSVGEKYTVEEQGGNFTKISIDDDLEGYVHNDYIDVEVTLPKAISLEEERQQREEEERKQREAEEAAERLRQEQAAAEAAEESSRAKSSSAKASSQTSSGTREGTTAAKTGGSTQSGNNEVAPDEIVADVDENTTEAETEAPSNNNSSSLREAIVSYAVSFAGNLSYVYGGTSLTSGADCSGFIQSIYKKYGVSLPRTSGEQGSYGSKVSSSNMRAGDIIFYGGHVAIYIGDGQVVHASSPSTGIKISTWNYRTPKSIRNVIGD